MANLFRAEPSGRLTGFSLVKHRNGEQASVLSAAFFEESADVSGTLAWSEASDIVSMTGTVASDSISGTVNWAEVNDTLSISSNVRLSGSMSSQDQSDTLAASGTLRVNASAGWSEQSDVAGFVGVFLVNGSIALQDQSDTLSASMDIAGAVSGAIEWQEQSDILLILANTFQFSRSPRGDVGQSTRAGATNSSRPEQNSSRMQRPAAIQRGTR